MTEKAEASNALWTKALQDLADIYHSDVHYPEHIVRVIHQSIMQQLHEAKVIKEVPDVIEQLAAVAQSTGQLQLHDEVRSLVMAAFGRTRSCQELIVVRAAPDRGAAFVFARQEK